MDKHPPATILVVDDNNAERYATARTLTASGFNVKEAENGRRALEIATLGADLILLDINMPGMSGFEVCHILKSNPATQHIPVLHLSATSIAPADRAKGLEGGADGFLIHPVEPEVLAASVRSLLRIKAAEERARQSEARFRIMGEILPYGVWWCNAQGGSEYVSQSFLDLLGMTQEEQRQFGWTRRLPPDEVDPMLKKWLHCVATGEDWDSEHHILGPDGKYHTVLTRGKPVRDPAGNIIAWAGINLDIDERKHTEEQLRDALQKLNSHLQNSLLGVTEWDKDFRCKYWSPQAEAIFGWKAEEVAGKHASEFNFIYADDLPKVERVFAQLIERLSRNTCRNRNVARDGSVRRCEWYNSALRDAAGNVTSVLSLVLDVTDSQRAEEALRHNEQQLRLAQAAAHMWTWELDGTLQTVTRRQAVSDFGPNFDASELAIEQWLERVHEEDRDTVRAAMLKALDQGTKYELEFRLLWHDGSYRWVYSRGSRVDDTRRMVGVAMDISERKAVQEALRRSEERARMAQSAASAGSWAWDMVADRVEWSPEYYELYGLEPSVKPSVRNWLRTVHRDDREPVQAQMRRQIAEHKDIDLEFRMIRGDGEVRWANAKGRTEYDASGAPVRMMGISVDITNMKRAEETLRLTEKLAATGRLAASLAHEINNPLAAVTNLLYLLGKDEVLSESARQYVHSAAAELGRVAHITRNLLSFYREPLHAVPLRLGELLDGVLELYTPRLQSLHITVARDYRAEGPIVGFPGELRQVFANLLMNAMEAVGESGRIKLRLEAARERNGARRSGLRVLVADNGPGISAALRRSIFEPFFTTKGEKGTGLGLWVSGGIVEKHGGHIRVHSSVTPGRSGTCFAVFLPSETAVSDAAPNVTQVR